MIEDSYSEYSEEKIGVVVSPSEVAVALSKKRSIALISPEVQEIISNRPNWIVRHGILFFFIIICSLIASTSFISYPDIINVKAKITSINTPKEVIANTSGKLIKLFANEGEMVLGGSILGYMESTADHQEIIKLSTDIDSLQMILQSNNLEKLSNHINLSYQNLGELQQSYQAFQQSLLTFRNYISHGFYLRKKALLFKDLIFLQKLDSNLLQQKDLNIQDIQLSQQTFDANKSLRNDKVISDFDYRTEMSKLINKKLLLPQMSSAIINNESQQNEKQKEIMELENTISQQESIFYQSLNTFKSQIDDWKKKYLLIAPIKGKVAFASFLQENQQLEANQITCYINPENSQYYSEVYIPQTNFGKVKIGQDVLLKFPSYPFEEYGSVKGRINFISNISTDSGYLAEVVLPNGLQTSYNRHIQFRDGLMAQGEIITENMRLLQKIYFNVVRQFKK